ncbi:MAG: class I SAM-dependent methyltransferase [Propionivibrio sp.]|uniref:class I SAM-dependent methyltransferase n=1 Tax=Propionivibrio sp. TaxID=2212460 RepID=UPI0025F782DE|nr:class I SAM-dependent methyltransferase [Propionivibrio sp.]MBK7354706.1 class I SAM-dependent methyltransferase [Propionivibrio sp.]MBK8402077.1 class I SAM-dependent methyltransferase [Propionivibrio sp.]
MQNEPKYRGFDTYTKNDHHTYIKENFKVLGNLIEEGIQANCLSKSAKVLDVGCATGALIGYLASRFERFEFEGLDISDELIGVAREKIPGVSFKVGGVMDLPGEQEGRFDVVLCIGVLGIFDEAEAKDVLYRLISCVRPGGRIYVFHQFNEVDIDVMVKHRRVGPEAKWDGWGAGWNIYSYRTVGEWLSGRVSAHRFVDFSMPFPLERQENPVRTWTIDMADGSRRLTNGLKLLVDLRFLEITV